MKVYNAPPTNIEYSVVAAWESFQCGQDRFIAREPMSACQNDEQRRGWMSALRAASDADTDVYLRGGTR